MSLFGILAVLAASGLSASAVYSATSGGAPVLTGDLTFWAVGFGLMAIREIVTETRR